MPNGEVQPRERASKILTQSEVEKCLIFFPISAVAGLFEFEFEVGRLFCMDVVSGNGVWNFLASFIKDEEMGPLVSISWPQFATENGLKANDEVIFERVREKKDKVPWRKFRVQVRRQIRLFGQDIWGDLMV